MDIYAETLFLALEPIDQLTLSEFKPESRFEKFAASRFVMRYLRYIDYPLSIKNIESDLHHVLDHGYAHLFPHLKSSNAQSKTCITVHDLIPMLLWNGSIKNANGAVCDSRKPWLNLRSLSYLKSYDRIVAVSNNTKSDLVNFLGLPEEKIDVISPIISHIFRPLEIEKIERFAQKYELDGECKWLMISGSEFYKNHYTCLKVLAELNRQHEIEFRIIKTGFISDEFNSMVLEAGLELQVRSIYLEDSSELALLYNFVDCLLFPSLYEGFGMPVAEAFACGTPVVTSDRGALPEVSGDLGAVCDAGNVRELSEEVTSMVFDQQRRLEVSVKGPVSVDRFCESTVVNQYTKFYQSM